MLTLSFTGSALNLFLLVLGIAIGVVGYLCLSFFLKDDDEEDDDGRPLEPIEPADPSTSIIGRAAEEAEEMLREEYEDRLRDEFAKIAFGKLLEQRPPREVLREDIDAIWDTVDDMMASRDENLEENDDENTEEEETDES